MTNKRLFSADRYPLVPENLLKHEQGFWEPEIYCDLHGVVLNWNTAFLKFASEVLGRQINPADVRFYHGQFQAGIGITPAEWDELFLQFVRLGEGGYGYLEPYPEVIKALHKIHDAGIRIKVATWTPSASELSHSSHRAFGTGTAQGTTLKLLQKLGVPVDTREVEFLRPGEKPFKMQEDHVPLILEDCPYTAVQVASVGLACILLPERYNEDLWVPGVTRLAKRSLLAPKVLEFFDKLETAGVLAPRASR